MFQKVTSSERTATITAECQAAFNTMTDTMKDFKRRFFSCPRLTEANLTSLGIRPRKLAVPTGDPTSQVTIKAVPAGRHELNIEIIYLTGSSDDGANKGCRIWYSAVAPGEKPLVKPEELRESFYTRRKTVYMVVQVKNEGRKGPWGPLVQALIP
ncbi:MAG: hypothetical protein LBQ55_02640 [Treponema sp.]|jgi:hypothetical protein|nr:hypothetical protein [Treponema sp.]